MTGAERQTLDQLYQLVGATAGKVDMILLSVGDIETRLRAVETATATDRAVGVSNDLGARDRAISKRWVIQVIVTAIGVTAAVVFGIVGLVSK